ncbi:Listeria/Bacterioides repeat-containing protein [Prevotella communis]|uniref:Listeria/Bacterioides repeat-containing protein n=1 Tax=Prevotella communis TaxID=2913614 RepID=A0A1G7YWM4_9BACT|nr:InlB B-repeat-containing protein [Prevotella communis]SDH00230.1 Listeria/Bacterioides repeat-containing protein [Prevotella communis]
MRQKPFRLFSRAALALLMMLLTTTSAWAQFNFSGNVKVNINGSGTVTVTHGGVTENFSANGTSSRFSGNYTIQFLPASGYEVNKVTFKGATSLSTTNIAVNRNGGSYNRNLDLGTDEYTVYFDEPGAASFYTLTSDGASMTFSVGGQTVTTAEEGQRVDITLSEPAGNEYWVVSSLDVSPITQDDANHFHFTMPARDVTVGANKWGTVTTRFNITDNSTHGHVNASGGDENGLYDGGETVTLTVVPDAGYEYVDGSLSATNLVTNEAIALTDQGDGTWTFTMPTASVAVSANFTAIDPIAPDSYTVHFNANGGTGTMADQTLTLGDENPLSPCTFTRLGFDFTGWNTKADGSGTSYADGEKVTDIAASGQTITLYAKWTKIDVPIIDPIDPIDPGDIPIIDPHDPGDDPFVGPGVNPGDDPFDPGDGFNNTVHFNANGGTGTMADQTFAIFDEKPLSPCTFTRTGYRFAGWNTQADGNGKAYTDQQNIDPVGNMTLYAQWTALPANTYYVHFDKNYYGAKGTMEDQMFTVGVAQALTANAFTDELLVTVSFSGWNTKADGSGISYSNKQVVTDIAAEGQIITLYAQWEDLSTHIPINMSCTVHFDANGGTGTMTDQSFESGAENHLKANTFTRDGYIFTGWNTKADGTGTAYADQEDIIMIGNFTLYAQWQQSTDLNVSGNTYTIHTATGWSVFCDLLADNDKGYFSGKTVKLGNNITVSSMAGSKDHEFTGTFNGQGNTLTVDYTTSTDNAAPFRYVDGGTIENLIVEGTITTSAKYAAGFIAYQYGVVSIRNCRSSVTINSSTEGDGTHGGFVGQTHSSDGHSITIEGCLFDGKLLGNKTTRCGGFIGWRGKTATIRNSLFAPTEVTVLNTESATFSRNKVDTYNCYYTNYLCDDTHYKPYLNDGNVSPALWNNGIEAYVYTPATESFVPANVGAAGTTYSVSGITAYASGLKYDGKFYMVKANVSLANNADNSAAIVNKQVADVTLSDRTLYKDGYWNTLVLPFAISDFTGTPLEDATVKELLTTSNLDNNGTLTLNFSDALTAIEAGKPYIVKWSKDAGYDANPSNYDLVNPVFTGVTIDNTNRDVNFTDGSGSFKGTYAPLEITDANRSKVLLLSGGNKLGYAKTDRTIANKKALGTCRAYFYFPGSQTARSFVMNFEEEGTPTGVGHTEITESTEMADAIYDLQGRRIEKPKKGLYIHGGKKVLVH